MKYLILTLFLSLSAGAATPSFNPTKKKISEKQLKQKLEFQKKIKAAYVNKNLKSAPRWNDQVHVMMEERPVLRNIYHMHEKKLMSGRVNGDPWSDSYWPIKRGILGNRYAVEGFNQQPKFDDCLNYIKSNPANEIYEGQDEKRIAALSPAEKYDLLFGTNSDLNLTMKMWAEGKRYFDKYGKVEDWMGICHGWAPASFMVPRPTNAIEVTAFDGHTKVKFYPADLKALASLLWAKAHYETLFVGGRCNDKHSDDALAENADERLSNDCIDTNPATWHLTTVNKIGRFKESFIIDATYDYEVWNQPMIQYNYAYFNPQTGKNVSTLQEAMVSIEEFQNDHYKKYRSPKAKKVVGINMTIVYGAENIPQPVSYDDPTRDWTSRVSYQYDLELNAKGEIIGGEWYQFEHPDFLWAPVKDSNPMSPGDHLVKNQIPWDGKQKLSEVWGKAAKQSASLGLPLATLVHQLIELSRK
jgi:hypothetical protein